MKSPKPAPERNPGTKIEIYSADRLRESVEVSDHLAALRWLRANWPRIADIEGHADLDGETIALHRCVIPAEILVGAEPSEAVVLRARWHRPPSLRLRASRLAGAILAQSH